MTDCFALLDEPRCPWLDPDRLKARFLTLSADAHPDRVHSATPAEREAANRRYAELNAAYNCLREPKDRLLHLIELETGARPKDIQRIPPGTMDLFVEIGQTCRAVDTFLSERSKVTSPLLKAAQFQQALEWTDRLQALQQTINARRDTLLDEIRAMNPQFESAPSTGSPERVARLPLANLETIYRALSYITRWTEQLQERLVQLAV